MPGTALLKHTWQTTIKNDSGTARVNDSRDFLGSNEFNEKIEVGPSETAEIDCGSLPYAKMVSLYITATKAAQINTNAADATGGQTIDLEANKAFAWHDGMPTANPITANITKIFVTNNDTENKMTFSAGFLLDLLA